MNKYKFKKTWDEMGDGEKLACIRYFPEKAKQDDDWDIRLAAYLELGFTEEAMGQVSLEALQASVQRLIDFANQNRQKIILLTKVGCGIAGFVEDAIKEHFREAPANIIKPKEWYA